MKRFPRVTLVVTLMASTSVLAADGSTVGRRASRQDLLSGHAQASSVTAAPVVADRAASSLLDQGLEPVPELAQPDIDVQGVVVVTIGGLFLEGVEANLELRRTDVRPSIRLDRVSMDSAELAEVMASKTPTSRPLIDRPTLAGN